LVSATELRQLLLENNASQGSVSASVDPKIETLNGRASSVKMETRA
jgi:hypothetical protein